MARKALTCAKTLPGSVDSSLYKSLSLGKGWGHNEQTMARKDLNCVKALSDSKFTYVQIMIPSCKVGPK